MPFTATTEYPKIADGTAARASYRSVVGGALRRALELIRAAAAGATATQYPNIAEDYAVVQASSGDLAFALVNRNPSWQWVEYPTEPHFPPWKRDSRLAQWVERKGMPPRAVFPIARKISRQGTVGHFFLTTAWGDGREALTEALSAAIGRWWASGGLWDGN
jgi:hypothetical protein